MSEGKSPEVILFDIDLAGPRDTLVGYTLSKAWGILPKPIYREPVKREIFEGPLDERNASSTMSLDDALKKLAYQNTWRDGSYTEGLARSGVAYEEYAQEAARVADSNARFPQRLKAFIEILGTPLRLEVMSRDAAGSNKLRNAVARVHMGVIDVRVLRHSGVEVGYVDIP